MSRMRTGASIALFLVFFQLVTFPVAFGLENPGQELKDADLNDQLGEKVVLGGSFTDQMGRRVRLGELFTGNTPKIIVPAYYTCPRLCGMVLSGVQALVSELDLNLQTQFEILVVSFNEADTPERALKQWKKYASPFEGASEGWRFLVGEEEAIRPLMDSLGFEYRKDNGEFAHSAALYVVTPDGRISQLFTGAKYDPFSVRLALVEASSGRIGSPLDHVLLFCFRFDPLRGRYTWAAFGLMRLGGVLTLGGLVALIFVLWRGERRRARLRGESSPA